MVPSSVGDKSSSVEGSRPGGSSVDVFIALMRNTERVLIIELAVHQGRDLVV